MSIDIVEGPTHTMQREVPSGRKPAATDVAPLKDPVCGMAVTVRSPYMMMHEKTAVYFCSAGCKAKFLANPAKYSIAPGTVHEAPAPNLKTEVTGTIYTCPMHPQIRQIGPGSCPICGMTLEPETPTLDSDENPELKDFRRRFFSTLLLTVIVAVLAMVGHRTHWPNTAMESWIELSLSLPIVLWAGKPFFVRAVESVIHSSPNMWTLIGLGTSAAFLYSLIATLAPGVFPTSFVVMGRVPVYFEAAAVIISLTLVGQLLELNARSLTSAAIKSLLGLAPKTARRINADKTEVDVPLTDVQVGDTLRVTPGEKILVDGLVLEGGSAVNESMLTEDEVLRWAASLDQGSEHLLAEAIVSAARERKLELEKATGFESIAGAGVRGALKNRQINVGNTALMAHVGVSVEELKSQAEQLRTEGASVMYLSADGKLAGLLAVSDPIKANTVEALAALQSSGIRVIMASGDGLTTAKSVAAKLGLDEVYGEVKPADKLALVDKLQQEGRIVAMAGDGINDAPALAKADVGVAMGTGTDVAMNSAQVTLVKGDLRGIAQARLISNETVANMKQNLGFAFLYNSLGVPLAAGVLYPFTGWLLSPMIAALAMSLSSVSVITNALRLRGKHG